mgnify:CR=1 FL=1
MKNNKRKININSQKGIALIMFIFIILLMLSITFFILYNIFLKNKEKSIENFYLDKELTEIDKKTEIENLGMDTNIVNDLVNGSIPVPQGYNFVQGSQSNEIIIENKENKNQYLFIPYLDNIYNEKNAYYNKVQDLYVEMDGLVLNSIKKYNGFFVQINSKIKYTDLKTIDNTNYKKLYKSLQRVEEKSINAHILYKEEIAQIEHYLSNNIEINNNIGIQALVIEAFSQISSINTKLTGDIELKSATKLASITANKNLIKLASTNNENNNNKVVYYYDTKSPLYGGSSNKEISIPIPNGFKYCETDGVVKIQDITNKNLVYIWIPLNYEEINANNDKYIKKQLWQNIYKKFINKDGNSFSTDTELYKMIQNSVDQNIDHFKKSIKKYNGFYISQAELSTNYNKQYINTARGMINNTVSETAEGGDYIRGTSIKENIYSEFEQIAKKSNQNQSVISHLIYGIEYDATLLWIANTNENYKDKNGLDIYTVLCSNSTNVGKYSNSKLSANANASDTEYFNGIWGLGGNLAEITQEKYENKYVLRGGSYSDTGEHLPIASRTTTTELQKDNIGIRTALYLPTDLIDGGKVNNNTTYGYVAKVYQKKYKTLQEAIASAKDNTKTTITLISDTSESVTIPKNKNIVLNMNNYTLRCSDEDIDTLYNEGILIIENTGKIVSEKYCALYNAGKLQISKESNIELNPNEEMCAICNDGELSINGAYLTTSADTNLIKNFGSITISSGKLVTNASSSLLYNDTNASLIIKNSKICKNKIGGYVISNQGKTIISGTSDVYGSIMNSNYMEILEKANIWYDKEGSITIMNSGKLNVKDGKVQSIGGKYTILNYQGELYISEKAIIIGEKRIIE